MINIQIDPEMKPTAASVLATNIKALLRQSGLEQKDLAQWCRHSDPWVSEFLNHQGGWTIKELGRIADLFRLEPYQLFVPGIGAYDRRRKERRVSADRRIGPKERILQELAADVDAARAASPSYATNFAAPAESRHEELRQLITEFADRLAPLLREKNPRGQTTVVSLGKPKSTRRDRVNRRQDHSVAPAIKGGKR